MKDRPLRTSVVGSYPFPAWLESCSGRLGEFGTADVEEMQELKARLKADLTGKVQDILQRMGASQGEPASSSSRGVP